MAINGAWDSDVSTDFTFANGDRDATSTSATALCIGTDYQDTGKFYFEVTVVTVADADNEFFVGVAVDGSLLGGYIVMDGLGFVQPGVASGYPTFTTGDVVGVAVDYDNSLIWWRVNGGDWNNDAGQDPAATTGGETVNGNYPVFGSLAQAGNVARINTGTVAFAHTPPSGFADWYAGSAAALTLTAAAGSYTVTGTAATLKRGRKTAAAAGSYAVTGTAATFRTTRRVSALAGSYAVTGQAATLKRGRKVTADPGSYTVTGQAATFRRTYAVGAAVGSYSVGGQDVTLRLGRKVAIGAAAYTVTGQSVSLILLGDTAILAESGAYTVTGQTAALRTTRIAAAGGGSYGIVGQPATMRVTRLLSAANTSYAVTGADAALTYAPITPPDVPSTGGGGSSGRLERQKKARKRIKHLREVVEAARKAREEERAPAIADEVRQAAAEMELPAELGGIESLSDVMASVGRLSKALNEEIKRLQAEDRQQAAAQKAREREGQRAQAEREEADEWDRLARILLLAS